MNAMLTITMARKQKTIVYVSTFDQKFVIFAFIYLLLSRYISTKKVIKKYNIINKGMLKEANNMLQ
jgi:hypothetical protein